MATTNQDSDLSPICRRGSRVRVPIAPSNGVAWLAKKPTVKQVAPARGSTPRFGSMLFGPETMSVR